MLRQIGTLAMGVKKLGKVSKRASMNLTVRLVFILGDLFQL